MKSTPYVAIHFITVGLTGIFSLPFLAVIVQYIDSVTAFSSGRGYLSDYTEYIFQFPLVFLLVLFLAYLAVGVVILYRNRAKKDKH